MIEEEAVWNNQPHAYSDQPGFESVEPIVFVGDKVNLSGWERPIEGTVVGVGKELLWVDVPIATPGPQAVVTRSRVQKIERNGVVWERSAKTGCQGSVFEPEP